MDLRQTLKAVHLLFSNNNIKHSLIGGLGLACHGSTRATVDLDLLILESDKEQAKQLLLQNGFKLEHESDEVLQFTGAGFVDILLARRPISQAMLKNSLTGGPEGISYACAEDLIGLKIQAYKNNPSRALQDKADIQFLIENTDKLDWEKIKEYAELFDEWNAIDEIKKKAQH